MLLESNTQFGGMRLEIEKIKKEDITILLEFVSILNKILDPNTEPELIPSSHTSSEVLEDNATPIRNHKFKTANKPTETSLAGGGRNKKKSKKVDVNNSVKEDLVKVLSEDIFCFKKNSKKMFTRTSSTLRNFMSVSNTTLAFFSMPNNDNFVLEQNLSKSKFKQYKLNEKNMDKLVNNVLDFNDKSFILLNKALKLDFNPQKKSKRVFTDWAKEFYKRPTETETGFIRYGTNYAITSPNIVLLLKTEPVRLEGEDEDVGASFKLCYLEVVKNTKSLNDLIKIHNESVKHFDNHKKVQFKSTNNVVEFNDNNSPHAITRKKTKKTNGMNNFSNNNFSISNTEEFSDNSFTNNFSNNDFNSESVSKEKSESVPKKGSAEFNINSNRFSDINTPENENENNIFNKYLGGKLTESDKENTMTLNKDNANNITLEIKLEKSTKSETISSANLAENIKAVLVKLLLASQLKSNIITLKGTGSKKLIFRVNIHKQDLSVKGKGKSKVTGKKSVKNQAKKKSSKKKKQTKKK